jgi:hypothetical protein
MSDLLTAEDVRRDQILNEAVDGAAKVVLTCRGADGWQTIKTAFAVGVCGDRCLRLAHLEGPPLEPGQRVGVAFRRGHRKYVFSTVVDSTDADGMLVLRRPAVIQQMQRRVYQRACPPPGRPIRVTIWAGHVEDDADQAPTGSPLLEGELEDLSVGGVRVRASSCPVLPEGTAVACSLCLTSRGAPALVNALYRHGERTNACFSIGFQFIGLETRADGPEVLSLLARTVTNFQRAAARRRPPGFRRHR